MAHFYDDDEEKRGRFPGKRHEIVLRTRRTFPHFIFWSGVLAVTLATPKGRAVYTRLWSVMGFSSVLYMALFYDWIQTWAIRSWKVSGIDLSVYMGVLYNLYIFGRDPKFRRMYGFRLFAVRQEVWSIVATKKERSPRKNLHIRLHLPMPCLLLATVIFDEISFVSK